MEKSLLLNFLGSNYFTSFTCLYCTVQLDALLSQSRQDLPEVRAKSSIGLVAFVTAYVKSLHLSCFNTAQLIKDPMFSFK